jgi:hypothetical protein
MSLLYWGLAIYLVIIAIVMLIFIRRRNEVFNVKNNVYLYPQASRVCAKLGAQLATRDQMLQAYRDGASWCNLGWVKDLQAYHPTSRELSAVASKWPEQFKYACGKQGINGGHYPPQLKLSVNCYGVKPPSSRLLNPWNTLTGQWSKYT